MDSPTIQAKMRPSIIGQIRDDQLTASRSGLRWGSLSQTAEIFCDAHHDQAAREAPG